MYKGVELIDYETLEIRKFDNMQWSSTVPSNYLAEINSFVYKYFDISEVFEYHIINLLSLILENVHHHGSGSCIVTIGIINSGKVIEIHEPNGGFDLKRLPKGTGGCGYREMKRSKCQISHSIDGKKTFVVISNRKE
jgi:hypothetical protein